MLQQREAERRSLLEILYKTFTSYEMNIGAEKTKLTDFVKNGIQRETKVKGQKLRIVKASNTLEQFSRMTAQNGRFSIITRAIADLSKQKQFLRDNNISFGSGVKLIYSRVMSVFLSACASWTLTAEVEERKQAFEMRCF